MVMQLVLLQTRTEYNREEQSNAMTPNLAGNQCRDFPFSLFGLTGYRDNTSLAR